MNLLRKYVLTRIQKLLILFIVLAGIGAGYMLCFYLPLQRRIKAADTSELELEIQLEQSRVMELKQMQREIEKNKASRAPMVPAYNHFKAETEELNRIFGNAYDFTFQYTEPLTDDMQIRRPMSLNFTVEDFDSAVSMIREVLEGPYRCMVGDLSIASVTDERGQERLPDIREDMIRVTMQLIYFETRYDADTEEGLPVLESPLP